MDRKNEGEQKVIDELRSEKRLNLLQKARGNMILRES